MLQEKYYNWVARRCFNEDDYTVHSKGFLIFTDLGAGDEYEIEDPYHFDISSVFIRRELIPLYI